MDGWTGIKSVLRFSLYFELIQKVCIYLLIHVIKICHQHSYGFKNLMSSWGVAILFSKLPNIRVFMKNYHCSAIHKNRRIAGAVAILVNRRIAAILRIARIAESRS